MLVHPSARRACLLLLALIPFLAAGCGGDPAPAGTADYTNDRHEYRIGYPDSLDLREYTPENVAIGRAEGEGSDALIEISLETGTADRFDSFMIERARTACAADGAGVSLQCTDVEMRETVTSRSGMGGEVLYLRHERTAPGVGPPLEISERGPFVAFDLSDRLPAGDLAVLFMRAPVTGTPEETDVELVLEVARSLERSPRGP